ncbi:MAG: ABC transporter ATP-binding protein [Planctomycetes bacterium]|nr:ABC transporter ATP-binding protein [Planctomycetota bacterium]
MIADSPISKTTAPLIELADLHKVYRVGTELVHALRGVSLLIGENEYVAIMGPSGSGKSTMMNIIGCLDVPTEGRYLLRGQDVSRMSQSRLARVRGRQIGFVFQSFELLPRTSALKNVELPLTYSGVRHRRKRAIEALRRVSLLDRAHHHPNQLSGGQKQRVAIARALAQEPDIILADEPTGNLDSTTGNEIMAIFDSLHAEGQTIIVVTHEDHVARRCRRTIKLMDGQIVLDQMNEERERAKGISTAEGAAAAATGGSEGTAATGGSRPHGTEGVRPDGKRGAATGTVIEEGGPS